MAGFEVIIYGRFWVITEDRGGARSQALDYASAITLFPRHGLRNVVSRFRSGKPCKTRVLVPRPQVQSVRRKQEKLMGHRELLPFAT
jgi:hypothetical protein